VGRGVFIWKTAAITSFGFLRAVKNRYGSVNEIGVFNMTGQGLVEVKKPFASFYRRGTEGRSRFGNIHDPRGEPSFFGRDSGAGNKNFFWLSPSVKPAVMI
jgi:hypothetical protein